jgi:hypothetical protein
VRLEHISDNHDGRAAPARRIGARSDQPRQNRESHLGADEHVETTRLRGRLKRIGAVDARAPGSAGAAVCNLRERPHLVREITIEIIWQEKKDGSDDG